MMGSLFFFAVRSLGGFPLIPFDVDLINTLARLGQIIIVLKI